MTSLVHRYITGWLSGLGSFGLLVKEAIVSLCTFKVAWRDLTYQIYFIGVKSQTVVLVTGAFTGGAIGSGLGALFVQQHLYRPLFLAAAGLSVLVVITAALARARYPASVLATPVEELAGS